MRYLLSLILLLSLWACEDQGQKVKDLNDEVLNLHDSSMVKMDAIYAKMSALRDLQKGMDADTALANEEVRKALLESLSHLQEADDAMMDWMSAYQPPKKEDPADESLEYLERQKISIVEVDAKIDESLRQADETLAKYKK